MDFRKRRNLHLSQLRRGVHKNSYLQSSFNKHGESCFKFDVIEEVDDSDQLSTEQWWLNNTYCLDPRYGYNLSKDTITPYKGMSPSDETRRKIGEKHKGKMVSAETRKKIGLASLGRRHTQEFRNRMSMLFKGKPKSEEHCKKISASNTGKVRSLETRKNISDALIQYYKVENLNNL
jgi:group I intron endonuclease